MDTKEGKNEPVFSQMTTAIYNPPAVPQYDTTVFSESIQHFTYPKSAISLCQLFGE
jgi:hypothetical protein